MPTSPSNSGSPRAPATRCEARHRARRPPTAPRRRERCRVAWRLRRRPGGGAAGRLHPTTPTAPRERPRSTSRRAGWNGGDGVRVGVFRPPARIARCRTARGSRTVCVGPAAEQGGELNRYRDDKLYRPLVSETSARRCGVRWRRRPRVRHGNDRSRHPGSGTGDPSTGLHSGPEDLRRRAARGCCSRGPCSMRVRRWGRAARSRRCRRSEDRRDCRCVRMSAARRCAGSSAPTG